MRRGPETQEESLEYPYKAQNAAQCIKNIAAGLLFFL